MAEGFHPVQSYKAPRELPEAVTRAAYEVYCELWGPQEALVTGWCRGGFGLLELIGYLYARSFPRNEWMQRFEEAVRMRRSERD